MLATINISWFGDQFDVTYELISLLIAAYFYISHLFYIPFGLPAEVSPVPLM